MSRYTGPKCKLCRREATKLFLKGDKCLSPKCGLVRRQQPPGVHGGKFRRRVSDYGRQLRAKQVVKRIYGVGEVMFRRYFATAERTAKNADASLNIRTGSELLSLLERRIDNVLYRTGVANSRSHARQVVRYGNVEINGKKTVSPSFLLSEGDIVTFGPKFAVSEDRQLPGWLKVRKNKSLEVTRLPDREDVTEPVEEQLIVEFYSR